jgi:branched-chain amino acid transport system ATP-binding protein
MLRKSPTCTSATARSEVQRGLSIQAPAGSVITVVGPNGAGKSTLLGALLGLLPAHFPKTGGLRFDGQDISHLSLEERVMRDLSLVPERRELFGTITVEDNLVLGGWRPLKMKTPRWRDGLEQVYTLFPRLQERCRHRGGDTERRRAVDAGHRPRADGPAQAADAERTQPGPGTADRARHLRLHPPVAGAWRDDPAGGAECPRRARGGRPWLCPGSDDVVLEGPADVLAGDPRIIETCLGARPSPDRGT